MNYTNSLYSEKTISEMIRICQNSYSGKKQSNGRYNCKRRKIFFFCGKDKRQFSIPPDIFHRIQHQVVQVYRLHNRYSDYCLLNRSAKIITPHRDSQSILGMRDSCYSVLGSYLTLLMSQKTHYIVTPSARKASFRLQYFIPNASQTSGIFTLVLQFGWDFSKVTTVQD